ncbi:hypothetical protein BOX15_Mlig007475g1 [Macrostomum lignano]|uniref:PH domain-containing protein n=1 Tax=Macrostomum lignano TaxID=282301 RepID=A0A267FKC8_9PLAT|nr:hypothetical protein BOX15_Mlig007475g1 [Macrostomum lignano]
MAFASANQKSPGYSQPANSGEAVSPIRALANKGENASCAECGARPTSVVGLETGGTFACVACAAVYRRLGFHTRSVDRDSWQPAELASLLGNLAVAQELERNLPAFYRRPKPHAVSEADAIRHQFVLAKYRRREFCDPALQAAYHRMGGGGGFTKEGQLWKRSKDSDKYFSRLFELSERDNYLRYFVKDGSAREVKATIPIDRLNVTMVGVAVEGSHPNLMQILYPDQGRTRSLYVYHEQEQEIISWYNAIRGCKYYRYRVSLLSPEELLRLPLTYDFAVCGWLAKTGPNQTEAWQRRWCFLLRRSLFYCAGFMEPRPRGEIWLGQRPAYSVSAGPPPGFRKKVKPAGQHVFTLSTPDRDYVFSADSAAACQQWLTAIDNLLDSSPTPQDCLYSMTRSNV